MNTFTAQELADFYQQVADGGEIQLYLIRPPENQPKWEDSKNGPNLASDPDMWRIKPKLKPVDMSVLIASGIDCEFTSRSDKSHWDIGKLKGIDSFYYPTWDAAHMYCRPRMNHIHAWQCQSFNEAIEFRCKLVEAGFIFSFDTLEYLNGVVLLLWNLDKASDREWPWEME